MNDNSHILTKEEMLALATHFEPPKFTYGDKVRRMNNDGQYEFDAYNIISAMGVESTIRFVYICTDAYGVAYIFPESELRSVDSIYQTDGEGL